MPIDAILVLAAVVAAFLSFAGVMYWADLTTRAPKSQP